MKMINLFNFDFESLNSYITKMISLKKSDFFNYEYINELGIKETFSCSYLINPELVVEIYSLLDFYLQKIVHYIENVKKIEFKTFYEEMKGSDLKRYCKYIDSQLNTKLVGNKSYDKMNKLRIIRDIIIHNGSHEESLNRIKNIEDIQYLGELITIKDEFIFDMLSEVKNFVHLIINTCTNM